MTIRETQGPGKIINQRIKLPRRSTSVRQPPVPRALRQGYLPFKGITQDWRDRVFIGRETPEPIALSDTKKMLLKTFFSLSLFLALFLPSPQIAASYKASAEFEMTNINRLTFRRLNRCLLQNLMTKGPVVSANPIEKPGSSLPTRVQFSRARYLIFMSIDASTGATAIQAALSEISEHKPFFKNKSHLKPFEYLLPRTKEFSV